MFRSGFVAVNQRLAAFRREEEGALVIFGLMLLTLMLLMLGFALDLIRYEHTRVRLQNTLDRATLAAASLEQTHDPEAVVRDYMLKAGISEQLASVQVTQALNERVVEARGLADTKLFFMPMLGIERFDARGASEAQQAISKVEIVLVLDVSGSMAGQKLVSLKEAATEFVDTVLEGDTHHRVSIAIVPYNAQVNIGPDLRTAFDLTHVADVQDVNCVELPEAAFDTQAIPTDMPMPMMAYADIAYNTNRINGYVSASDVTFALPNYASAFCKQTSVNVVRLPSTDPVALKAQINALTAGGNTSITLGMKWGATMIDPSMRNAYAGFIADEKMSGALVSRPFDYDDDVQKVVVLMTDGEHVAHNRITDDYKTGPSNIYQAPDGFYSVHFETGRPASAGANEYYVPHLNSWQATPWNNGLPQTWESIWTKLKMTYVAWQFYARPLGVGSAGRTAVYNDMVKRMRSIYAGPDSWTAVNAMDASLQATCDQVRANGVLLYGITVEAPAHGNEVITNCATADRTFLSDRNTIRSTFQTIAANLSALRLTQ